MDRDTEAYMRRNGLTWREMHDYPMSWDYYRMLCVYNGEADPGPCEPKEDSKLNDMENRVGALEARSAERGSVPSYYHNRLLQLQGRVLHAEAKLNEHLDKSKRRKGRY